MSDLEVLGLVLAALYLSECVAWVRRGAVAIVSPWARRWKVAIPSEFASNERGGLVGLNPLPPLGRALLAQAWPVSVSPDGVGARDDLPTERRNRSGPTPAFLRFEDIRTVEARGNRLVCNGTVLGVSASSRLARELADRLRELRGVTLPERGVAIEKALARSLDAKGVSDRIGELCEASRTLAWLCNVLFVHLFVATPLVLHEAGPAASALPLLVLLAALLGATALAWKRAHRRLLPDDADGRRSRLLAMLLAPPAAIRAIDLLGRDVVATHHPLAVARALCDPASYLDLARRVRTDLRFPIPSPGEAADPEASATERWYREALLRGVDRHLREAGADPEGLHAPPRAFDSESLSFCPRCRSQYAIRSGGCPDCVGLTLQSF